jgi:hyperosmotically inducible periplasmic protein
VNTTEQSSRLLILACAAFVLSGAYAARAAGDIVTTGATTGVGVADTATTRQVKAKLANDSRLNGSAVSVSTDSGVVTLSGTATSATASMAAETLAHSVSGVQEVDNEIAAPEAGMGTRTNDAAHPTAMHQTAMAISDSAITTALKTKYAVDRRTHGADVSVTTNSGVVALSGSAVSMAQKDHVILVARMTRVVSDVDSSALNVAQH